MKPTEQMIYELASQVERYKFALSCCLIGAKNGQENVSEAQMSLKCIENFAQKALETDEEIPQVTIKQNRRSSNEECSRDISCGCKYCYGEIL